MEAPESRDLVWSCCSSYTLVMTRAGSIHVFDRFCVEICVVWAHQWMPKDALSACLKIFPHDEKAVVGAAKRNTTEDRVVSILLHVLLVSGHIGTLELTWCSSSKDRICEYSNQKIELRNFESLPCVIEDHLHAMGLSYLVGGKSWVLDGSVWLPRSSIMLVVCRFQQEKLTAAFGSWFPFSTTSPPRLNISDKFSIFLFRFDNRAFDKKKVNPKTRFWSSVQTEPALIACLPVEPLTDLNFETESTDLFSKGLMKFWENNGYTHDKFKNHFIVKVISDPFEK